MNRLKIKELTFSAAHYISHHAKCGAIHGHTFFIRNLTIDCEQFVDFADVKKVIMQWDHTFIVPEKDYESWLKLIPSSVSPWRLDMMTVQGDPTCEILRETIRRQILSIPGAYNVQLELYEGPNQGVSYHDDRTVI